MYDFTSNISHLLCCIPSKRRAETSDDNAPSTLTTFQLPASTLSVHLPHNTVPHSLSDSHSEDARALHHIFSSSSSVRGYQTAATTPGYVPTSRPSLDLDFKFGDSSFQVPPSRASQIGNRIKQRLSESRLSKASSRLSKQESSQKDNTLSEITETQAKQTIDGDNIATSQSSAGLSELLASGNVSRGGYDSDARSLNSPVLSSNSGTIKIGSGFVKHALDRLEHNLQPLVSPKGDTDAWPKADDVRFPSPAHEKAQSSPLPVTPKKTSFMEALQIGNNESPTDVLRRLSAGLANGTINTPDTPELRAARLPSIKESDNGWRLSAPKRSSSLPRSQTDVQTSIHRLSQTINSARRADQAHSDQHKRRTSLISELDQSVLDYIDKYNQRYSESGRRASTGSEQDLPPATSAVVGTQSMSPPVLEAGQIVVSPAAPPTVVRDVDRDSLHLFNMRISQRLASHSQIPVSSPASSLNASCQSVVPKAEKSQPHSERVSSNSQPRRVVSEHNRRPSDPQTRRFFEGLCGKDQSQSWKTITSTQSGNSRVNSQGMRALAQDNASSCYLSKDEADEQSHTSPVNSTKRNSHINPHSFAIGGRSLSGVTSLPRAGPHHLSPADSRWSQQLTSENIRSSGDSWLAPSHVYQRGRSASMPQKRLGHDHVSPTPISRKGIREATAAAENLSEISLDHVLDRRNENMTEISAQDVKMKPEKQTSEIDHTKLSIAGDGTTHLQTRHRQNPDGRPVEAKNLRVEATSPESGVSASDAHERGLKQGLEENSVYKSALPANNKHEHQSGHISSPSSLEAGIWESRGLRTSLCSSRRSRSADDLRRLSAYVGNVGRELPGLSTHLQSLKTLPAMQDLHDEAATAPSKTPKEKQRKESILDLKRHFTNGTSEFMDNSGTPFKDLISMWSRFPSHTRIDRNGPAGKGDRVLARDFVIPVTEPDSKQVSTPSKGTDLGSVGGVRFTRLWTHDKAKDKSMTLKEPLALNSAARARKDQGGIFSKWKRLYRSSSSDLRQYAFNRGHRSSIGLGDAVEYPELECLPGEGMFTETSVQRLQASLMVKLSEEATGPSLEAETPTGPLPKSRPAAVDWGKYYGDCIGGLSALKSETELEVNSTLSSGGPTDTKSLDVRDSTVNFQEALDREQDKLKEQLMEKISKFDGAANDGNDPEHRREKRASTTTTATNDTVLASSIRTKDVKIPGSFS